MNLTRVLYILVISSAIAMSCNQNGSLRKQKGSFAYDYHFLMEYLDPVVLSNHDKTSMLLISPEYQGRVMTSTAAGMKGYSFGWINYDLIKSGEINKQFNPYGGEERLWLGPEGGQYSIFFNQGEAFDFANWETPAPLDTEPFQLEARTNNQAAFSKKMKLVNYSGFVFDVMIERRIELIEQEQIKKQLNISADGVDMVGYTSTNSMKNAGNESWKKESGLLSIWMLGMFNPSPKATIFIPYLTGSMDSLGYIVNDRYFGDVPDDRLKIEDDIVYFKADGKHRSKIGIPPKRATSFAASFDPLNQSLTILEINLPNDLQRKLSVNSTWEIQEKPYDGDVINAYNDGPLEDGNQLGPFYELESSSPASELAPGETITHVQSTYHFIGSEEALSSITETLFDVKINTIKSIF